MISGADWEGQQVDRPGRDGGRRVGPPNRSRGRSRPDTPQWLGRLAVVLVVLSTVASAVAFEPRVATAGDDPAGVATVTQVDVEVTALPGSGTAADPYRIANASELQAMADDLDAHYVLVEDVDAAATVTWNGGAGFAPVGNLSSPFNGTFDGAGYTIAGLTIDRGTERWVGLFGAVGSGGTVSDVALEDLAVVGGRSVGGLVGYNRGGTVTDVAATGAVTGTEESTIASAGGLVGETRAGTVANATAAVTVTGEQRVGGLVGYGTVLTGPDGLRLPTVIDASASGTVTSGGAAGGLIGRADARVAASSASGGVTGGRFVGGLVGTASQRTTVTDSAASGPVTGEGPVGGLAGSNAGAVTNVSASGTVTGEGAAGGLVGVNHGTVTDSVATGTVNPYPRAPPPSVPGGERSAGGLVGWNSDSGTVADSTATGAVHGGIYVGGLVGENDGTVTDATASGNVTGVQLTRREVSIGGLVGLNRGGTVSRSLASGTVDGTGPPGGTAFGMGGLVGTNEAGTVTDSTATGDVLGPVRVHRVGGLVGTNSGGRVVDSAAVGDVSGEWQVGGLVGGNRDGTVTGSAAEGNVTGTLGVGGLVGENENGTVDRSTASGSVAGETNVGGLVGHNYAEDRNATVSNSSATGTVDGFERLGGLVGWNRNGVVADAAATGTVTGSGSRVGGLVGWNEDGTVSNGSATGDATGERYVGGLVGLNEWTAGPSTVTRSSAEGTVTATNRFAGGLVGWNLGGTVTASVASGAVAGGLYVGGLAGANTVRSGVGTVSNVSASGPVDGSSRVGGLLGLNAGTTGRSFASGPVDGRESVGGLVGLDDGGTVREAYWDTATTGRATSAGGTGLVTAEMTGLAARGNMTGLDVPGTWLLTDGYPALHWADVDPFLAVNVTRTTGPVDAGDTLAVTATVTNYGRSGTGAVGLTDTGFSDTLQDEADVRLDTGGSAAVTLSWTTDRGDEGSGPVTVASPDDADSVEVAVLAGRSGSGGGSGGGGGGGQPGAESPGEVELVGASLVTGTVATGEEVLVEASLVNYDPTAGRLALTLTAGGTPVAERTVSVGASTERTVSLTHRFGEAGTHELAVNGRSVGTLTVRDPPETATPTPAATPTPPAGTSAPTAPGESDPDGPTGTAATTATARPGTPAAGPGFTALLALLALGLGGLLARRRLR